MRNCFIILSLFWALSGCVERALVITSEPSGANVVVNQQWKGKTPYVVPFKHYGVYDIWIDHPGIEENGRTVKFYPMHVGEPIKAPGYQYTGVDFVTEVLLPTTLRDQHNLHYVLERVDQADDIGDVLARAEQLRLASRQRGEMRYQQDVARGRYPAQTAEAEPEPQAETLYQQPDAAYLPGYQYGGDDNYSDIDATPPMPSEVPLFVP